MVNTKEADLNSKLSVVANIPSSLFNLSQDEFVDGLIKHCNNSEDTALKTVKDCLASIKDGYTDKAKYLSDAKNKLEKMIEAKNMTFRDKCAKLIKEYKLEERELPRAKSLTAPGEYFPDKNSAVDEEIYQLINNNIHPNVLYSRRYWRYEDKNGNRYVFQLQGIDKKSLNKDGKANVKVVTKEVDETENGRQFITDGQIFNMPASRFVEIIKSPINKDIYSHVMKGESEDNSDWMIDYTAAKTNMKNDFNKWYDANKEAYDLDTYNRFDIMKVYKLTRKGFTIPQAFRRTTVRANESVLDEAEKISMNKDAKTVQEVLSKFGINDRFMTMPFTVKDTTNMRDEDKEPDRHFIIVGTQEDLSKPVESMFIKDYDKGGRAIEISMNELLEILNRPENANPRINLWDRASTIRKQNMPLSVGKDGKFHELTKDEILAALELVQNDERFKDIDLKAAYLEPQSYERRNAIVGMALKAVDPDYLVKAIRTTNGFNGISYQIFIPNWDNPKTKPSTSGYKFMNPYQQIKKDWFNA